MSAASESLESLDVVLAGVHWGLLGVVLVALLHAFHDLVAFRVCDVEGSSLEVSGEEVSERRSLGSSGGEHAKGHGGDHGVGSWGSEHSAVLNIKSLHVWVSQIALRHDQSTLEGMSWHHEGMGMIYRKGS